VGHVHIKGQKREYMQLIKGDKTGQITKLYKQAGTKTGILCIKRT
jgi:hypothetical protein